LPIYSEEKLDRIGRLVEKPVSRTVEAREGPKFPAAKPASEKHRNRLLFQRFLKDRDIFIYAIDTALERKETDWNPRYISKGGFGDTYLSQLRLLPGLLLARGSRS
jgi:hypothetical protein